MNIGARAVDLAVTKALQLPAAPFGIERRAVEVEGDDVVSPDETRRHVAREQEVPGRLVVPRTDVTKGVDDALLVQNAIGDDQLVDKFGIGHKLRQGVNLLRFQKNRM